MNALEQLLQEDLNLLVDRISATTHEGTVVDCAERRPELASRLAEAETRLSAARRDLLQGYVVWQETLQECGDLWALADLACEPPTPGERRAA